jgi:hypothetical protein
MPSASYKLKRENTKLLTEKVDKFVEGFTGTLDSLCDDPDEFLMMLDVADNVLTSGEMERMKDILGSLRLKLKDTMRSHLVNQIKKDESMLNAICSKMEVEKTEADEKNERDAELRREKEIETNPLFKMLTNNLTKDDSCCVNIELLTLVLGVGDGKDIRALHDREVEDRAGLPTWLQVMENGLMYLNDDKTSVNAEVVGIGQGRMTFDQIYGSHFKLRGRIYQALRSLNLRFANYKESESWTSAITGYRWTGSGADSVNIPM